MGLNQPKAAYNVSKDNDGPFGVILFAQLDG